MARHPALDEALKLHQSGRLAEAEAIYRRVLAEAPEEPDALHLLGLVEHGRGRHDEAEALIARAMLADPGRPGFSFNLGLVKLALGNLGEAATCFARAALLKPDWAEAHGNHGVALGRLGRYAEAVAPFERTVDLNPQAASAWAGLAEARRKLKRFEEAEAAARRSLAVDPAHVDALLTLGDIRRNQNRHAEAEPFLHEALRLAPERAAVHHNLGVLYDEAGRTAEAEAAFRRAVALEPAHAVAHASLLMTMLYDPAVTEADVFAAHRAWAETVAPPAAPLGFAGRRDPDRPLRIGLVSPDFRRHSCAYFIEPLLARLDRVGFSVHAFADVARPDAVTARLRELADGWHDIAGREDAEVAASVVAAGIDVLVDLAGHSRGGRLNLFARRAAPVQVSWLGYPGTTGLSTFAARLTDGIADPPGSADALHSEPLRRLDPCFLVYRPPADAPAVAVRGAGPITFGSFNNLAKLSDGTVEAWATIVNGVAQSRLLLKGRMLDIPAARQRILQRFAARGLDAERIELHPWIAAEDGPLALYGRVDVGLDTFPYNGTTTTCEALWMGVPVVSLRGERHAARVGASLLSAIGCPELIAETTNDYIAKAVALGRDAGRQAGYRAGLRARMAASPLRAEADFARRFEAALRDLWRAWCAT